MSQINLRRASFPGVPNLAKVACSIVFSLAAVTAVAQTSAQPVTATIDASKTGKTAISPYLYGQFVEHAGDIQKPVIASSPVDAVPSSLTLPPYSINIYELAAK